MQLEQPQSIRTIFFDAGYTLLYPFPSPAAICLHVCQQLHLHIHEEQLEQRLEEAEEYYLRQRPLAKQTWADSQAITALWIGYYMHLLRPFVEEQDEQRLRQLALGINEAFGRHTSWQTYADVLPTLQALHQRGYKLGVISDWGLELGPILHRLHLTRYFDCVLISAATRSAKPSPQLYELALQRADTIGDYSIHIGDSYVLDVLGARSVGMTPILLDRSKRLEPKTVDCLLVHSLSELLDLLEIADAR